jgi:TP901 family phage tail tape measure protein
VALSTRELLLILRARDEASRVVRTFSQGMNNMDRATKQAMDRQIGLGTAISTAGVAVAAAGVAAIKWFDASAKKAGEYQRAAALTRTQIDNVGTSIKQVADIGKRVGGAIGAPFEQLQPTLFDIFSSMDVGLKDAENMLAGFARAGVAGQTDVQTAARATIAIMNAFNVPVAKVNDVLDFQFQLVRKGVGTYEEFATTIGRSIPSAVRSGQTYQTLGGMLAYLTRNGLSAAMATASAGRALDAISNPKTVTNLKDLGKFIAAAVGPKGMQQLQKASGTANMAAFLKSLSVNALDAKGKFKPLVQIVGEMQKAMDGLSKPQRAAVLQNLFKGAGGTIQARRFFDVVLSGKGEVKDFTNMVVAMQHANGQAGAAFKTMADTYSTKLQLMKNRWEILRIEVGEMFLPKLTKVIDVVSNLISWWNKLDPGLRSAIVRFTVIASAAAVIVGTIMAIVGAFILFSAGLAAAGFTLGVFAGIILGIVAVLAIVAIAVFFAIKYWDKLKAVFIIVKDAIVDFVKASVGWIMGTFVPAAKNAGSTVYNFFARPIKAAIDFVWPLLQQFGGWWADTFGPIIADAVDFAISKWQEIKTWAGQTFPPIRDTVVDAWNRIKAITEFVWPAIRFLINKAVSLIVATVKFGWDIIKVIFTVGASIIYNIWQGLSRGLPNIFKGMWLIIKGILGGALQIIMGILQVFIGLFTGNWKLMWQGIQKIFAGIWSIIQGIFRGGWNIILGVLKIFAGTFQRTWDTLWGGIKTGAQRTAEAVKKFWDRIKEYASSPVRFMINTVYNNGIVRFWNAIIGKIPGMAKLGTIKGFAAGGPVGGRPTTNRRRDDTLAMVQRGEYIMPVDRTRKYFGLLEAMRNGGLPGFADGGLIDRIKKAGAGVLGGRAKDIAQEGLGNVFGAGLSWVRGQISSHLTDPGLEQALAKLATAPLDKLLEVIKGKEASQGGSFINGIGKAPGNVAGNAALGKSLAASLYAWTGAQWNALYTLWQGESGWNNNAQNPTSTAYGIAQFLNSTWAGVGASKTSSAAGQIVAGLKYISQVYGNPSRALGAWMSRSPHWYDNGGVINEEIRGIGMRSGRAYGFGGSGPETVSPGVGGASQVFYITTQEIDPRKHAADLGWELALRVGG